MFTSRSEGSSTATQTAGTFDSLDDALDTLFEGGEDQEAQDQRHWPLFRTMPRDVFLDFVMALETRDFEPAELIVRQGEEGAEMFLIADGSVDVEIEGNPQPVASLEEGDFFGEASLLTRSPRNASCRARVFTNCLVLTRAHLEELAASHPSVMDSIRSIYYNRLEQNAARNQ